MDGGEVVTECWSMRDYTSLSPGKLSDALTLLAFRRTHIATAFV
jgi:hypothetical protein